MPARPQPVAAAVVVGLVVAGPPEGGVRLLQRYPVRAPLFQRLRRLPLGRGPVSRVRRLPVEARAVVAAR